MQTLDSVSIRLLVVYENQPAKRGLIHRISNHYVSLVCGLFKYKNGRERKNEVDLGE